MNTNIGHQHPKVIAAIQEQAAKIATIAPQHVSDVRSEAARLIAERTPGDLNKIFFTNGGADAVEHAVRMARLHTGRNKVLSAYRSYHGGTHMAVNITGDPRRFASDKATDGVVHFFPAYPYRSYFNSTTEAEETERALKHLEDTIILEGPGTIAALILETIPGTAGIYLPPPGYLQGVRELTRKYGIVYIADEVMAGFGRSGEWFAVDHWNVTPDLLTFAKGVNSGYVPLGGVAISEPIFETFREQVYPGGLTYSGHPLACAAAVATINAMEDEGMIANAKRLGDEIIGPRLRQFATEHPRGGRGARHRGVLGDRAGQEPGHPRTAGPLRGQFAADERGGGRGEVRRPAAHGQLQPAARRPGDEHPRRGAHRGTGPAGTGPHRGRPLRRGIGAKSGTARKNTAVRVPGTGQRPGPRCCSRRGGNP